MKSWTISAEHCGGKSIGHPCTTGVHSDPAETLCYETIDADTEREAELLALQKLEQIVEKSEPCDCRRRLQAGSNSWWNSVVIHVEAND